MAKNKLRNKKRNMKKSLLTITLALLTAFPAFAQDTLRLSLADCVDYATSHNLTLQAAALSRESAAVSTSSAKWNFAPMISANAGENLNIQSGGTSLSSNAGVNANMTLFSGLANLRTLQQSRLSEKQSGLKEQQSRNSVEVQIVQTYLTMVMNKERLGYQEDVLKTTEAQRDEGRMKYEVGRLLESDYLLLNANYESALANIENTKLTIENNRVELRNLLNYDGNSVLDVESAENMQLRTDLAPLDDVVRQAMESMPDMKISDLDVEIAKKNVSISRSSFSPTLGLNAGANYYGGSSQMLDQTSGTIVGGGNFSGSVGLNLSIPLLRGNSITQVKQSKINLRQAELQRQQTSVELRKTIESQYITTKQAQNQYASSQLLKDAYQANYNVYVLKYNEGAVTTVDMLQQQDRYLSSVNDYLQNKYTYLLDRQILDIYTR